MKNFISKLNTVKSIIRTNKTYETLLNWFTYWWKEKLSSLGMNNMERFSLTPKAKHASQTLRSVSWVVSPIAPLIK